MNFKEKMSDLFMGSMSPEEKNEMMDNMMNKFFADMKPEDRQKMMTEMMDKFFSKISAEEKQAMMQNMMPRMMGGDSGSPMMNMMGMMMGGGMKSNMMKSMMGDKNGSGSQMEMPWDMCQKMMSNISKTSELATFATPEVRELFEEWASQIEEEILSYVQESQNIDVEKIAEHFKLSKNSTTFFLTRLSNKGKINLKAQKVE